MQLNSTLENLKSKLYDGINESDAVSTSEALEDYRSAVEYYRIAIEEFESEMSQATRKIVPTLAEVPSDNPSPIFKSEKSLSYSKDGAALSDDLGQVVEDDHRMSSVSRPEDDSLSSSKAHLVEEIPLYIDSSLKIKHLLPLED